MALSNFLKKCSMNDSEDVKQQLNDSEAVKRQFASFDQNKSGEIERAELAYVLELVDARAWTPANIDMLLKQFDTNQDGKVQYSEFVDFIFKSGEVTLLTEEEEAKVTAGPNMSTSADGKELPTVPSDAAVKRLISSVKKWRYSGGVEGESEWDDDSYDDFTVLTLEPDLTFSLLNGKVGNSASVSGGGYKYDQREIYTGTWSIIEAEPSGDKHQLSLKPSKVKIDHVKDYHAGGRDANTETQDFLSGDFIVSISAQQALIQAPRSVSLRSTSLAE
eukprot:TRINITY_DN21832_c0_g1_i1.p1 TRINITY_DN21832_c0_g1~~TRINITY_DN21832_c0_g1_i1.p1  ORF type:complete len:276 (-),score=48.37 TRINITY_DN21832_c0_g1_i1:12-839(-)